MPDTTYDVLSAELDRQVDTLVRKGVPALLGLSEARLRERLEALREPLAGLPPRQHPDHVPFVVVVTGAPLDQAMPLVELRGKHGFTTMAADDLKRFAPIEGLDLPAATAYLLVDVDTGGGSLNVTPDDALPRIVGAGRSPLTVDEGVALVTHHPELLRTHNAFSLLGSRCGDRRVTAIWVSAGRPRLGWCWAGNPHTWLGSASCAGRLGG